MCAAILRKRLVVVSERRVFDVAFFGDYLNPIRATPIYPIIAKNQREALSIAMKTLHLGFTPNDESEMPPKFSDRSVHDFKWTPNKEG